MLPLEYLTIGQLLRRTAARFPDRLAMAAREQDWTYRQLDEAADRCARRLLSLGIRRGDRVGILCEMTPDAIITLYGVVRIGAVCTMLNTSLKHEDLRQMLERTDVSWLLVGDGYKTTCYADLCQGLEKEVPSLRRILYIGRTDWLDRDGLWDVPMASREELMAAADAVVPEDTAFILFTSGTTSAPKAVMGSHFSRVNGGIQQAHDLGATEQDRFCAALPIFHCFCLSVNVLASCAVGACLYLPRSQHTATLLTELSEGKCTVFSSVPTLFHAMIRREDFDSWDLSALRTGFIGGSMCSPALFREIEEKFGFTLLSSLGQTEATAGLTTANLTDSIEVRSTTLGHFMDHVEGKIANLQTGEAQSVGEAGEICVRGYLVMQGYYGQPEETARVIDTEGWLHTGDLGYLDEAGNLHMTGRLKELIIRGGENISPAEVENTASACPGVGLCKAVGVPDDHYGEEVCLCVLPGEGTPPTEEQLREWLSARLAFFKVPRYILFLQDFPRTSIGKIQLAELEKLAAEKLGLAPLWEHHQKA